MGNPIVQILGGLALTAVTSFLQTRQAKANKKTRDNLIAARFNIQDEMLKQDAQFKKDAFIQKRRLEDASIRNKFANLNLGGAEDYTLSNIQTSRDVESAEFVGKVDESYARQKELGNVEAELAEAPEQLGIIESIFGAATNVGGNIIADRGVDNYKSGDFKKFTSGITDYFKS
mgnify:CR=1 FL=1|tara:strand:+ start:411 stop:932 length:522 start_codon:yes stop_codon:yes gene_type:complete